MTRCCSAAHHRTLLVSREVFEVGTKPLEGRSGLWDDIDGRLHETRLWVLEERRAA